MRDKSKKILSLVAAATMLSTAFAFGGCNQYYKNDETLSGINKTDAVSSNGGFVVEKGDYVYFINAQEVNSAPIRRFKQESGLYPENAKGLPHTRQSFFSETGKTPLRID